MKTDRNDTATVYAAYGETDQNEGRGPRYLVGVYSRRWLAEDAAKGKGVMGLPGDVREETVVWLDGECRLVGGKVDIIEPTEVPETHPFKTLETFLLERAKNWETLDFPDLNKLMGQMKSEVPKFLVVGRDDNYFQYGIYLYNILAKSVLSFDHERDLLFGALYPTHRVQPKYLQDFKKFGVVDDVGAVTDMGGPIREYYRQNNDRMKELLFPNEPAGRSL